jgi:hypothetical protein
MTMQTFGTKIDDSQRTKCEVWTRVMGYCRPVSNFNKGKKSEFEERRFFTESSTLASMEGCGCSFGKKVA